MPTLSGLGLACKHFQMRDGKLNRHIRKSADPGCLDTWEPEGEGWQTIRLESYLPDNRVPVESMMTIDMRDRLHIVITAVDPVVVGDASHWGHPSSEVFHLCSEDHGETFVCTQISPADPTTANWLPSISRPGPYHPVDTPTILYTHGDVGSGLTPDTKTEIWCLRVG
jgi:hypothetical protein